MALNIFQNDNQSLMLMQKQWSSQLNPLLAVTLSQGSILNGIKLIANTPLTFNHYLGRQMNGWIPINKDAFSDIKSTEPLNSQTLTLESSADVTIALWVF